MRLFILKIDTFVDVAKCTFWYQIQKLIFVSDVEIRAFVKIDFELYSFFWLQIFFLFLINDILRSIQRLYFHLIRIMSLKIIRIVLFEKRDKIFCLIFMNRIYGKTYLVHSLFHKRDRISSLLKRFYCNWMALS